MSKRIKKELNNFVYRGQSTKITIGTIIISLFFVLLIIVSTFTQFEFTHPVIPGDFFNYFGQNIFAPENSEHFLRHYRYIPQVPVIFFIVGILGRRFALFSIFTYILIGLFLYPVFGLGGGINYILEYGFGFILGYIPAIYYAGTILDTKFNWKTILHAAVVGVLAIHVIGVLYLSVLMAHKPDFFANIVGWTILYSGTKIFYDIFFSIIALYFAKVLKKFFWLAMD